MAPIKPTNTLDLKGLESNLNKQTGSPLEAMRSELYFGAIADYLNNDYKGTILSEIQSGDSKQIQFRAGILRSIAGKFNEIATQLDGIAKG